MTWGFFTTTHIITMIFAILIIIGLHFVLKNKSEKTQTVVLFTMSLFCVGVVIFDLIYYNSPFEYLPLHLCSINAIVLPFAVLTKNKKLNNLLLLWSLGAVAAIVLNSATAHVKLFSLAFNKYYFAHILEFGIPILMFSLGRVKKDVKCFGSTVGITFATYTAIHFINMLLNTHFKANNIMNPSGNLVQVNYMYSLQPNNPLSALFFRLIPYKYWYNLPVILIICVYLILIYVQEIKKIRNASRT